MRRLVVLVGLAGLLAAGLFAIAAPSSAPAAKGNACPEHRGGGEPPDCGREDRPQCRDNQPGKGPPQCRDDNGTPPEPQATCDSAQVVLPSRSDPQICVFVGEDAYGRAQEECGEGATILFPPEHEQSGQSPVAVCFPASE